MPARVVDTIPTHRRNQSNADAYRSLIQSICVDLWMLQIDFQNPKIDFKFGMPKNLEFLGPGNSNIPCVDTGTCIPDTNI